jgi:aminopeptidase N
MATIKYRNGKLTKSRAIELAVLALHVSVSNGDIQNEQFDDAIEVLEKYFDIGKLYKEFYSISIEEFESIASSQS